MASYFGVQYTPTALQRELGQQFRSTLNPEQLAERQIARTDNRQYVQNLTPEQKAERNQWHIAKLEGAPPSVWKSEKQQLINSLNPQQLAERTATIGAFKTFRQGLSPEQANMRQSYLGERNVNVLNALGGGTNNYPPVGTGLIHRPIRVTPKSRTPVLA